VTAQANFENVLHTFLKKTTESKVDCSPFHY